METEIIRVYEEDIALEGMEQIAAAGEMIKAGGLVAFPTETVYGLGGNALDPNASAKIYAAKGRPQDNPLIVHIADKEKVWDLTPEVPLKAERLMDAFWPGPLTMILERSEIVPLETTGGLETVAVRMPSHKVARELIRAAGGYVAAPSANLSGHPSPTTAAHVINDLSGKIDCIIDGGDDEIGLASTFIVLTVDPPAILRPGYITQEDIESVIGLALAGSSESIEEDEAAPKAPGMKYRHYAPKAELVIVDGEETAMINEIQDLARQGAADGHVIGIIASAETMGCYDIGIVKSLGSRLNQEEIARNLYRILREFDDNEQVDLIYSESFRSEGFGVAIMNRLRKAAGGRIIEAETKNRRVDIHRIVFVSNEDVTCGPMAAAVLASKDEMEGMSIESRGMSVLFPEPLNPKVEAIMASHGLHMEGYQAAQLEEGDITPDTLFITMNTKLKEQMLKKYRGKISYIYTLSEYIGEPENEVELPYGEDLSAYAEFYDKIDEKLDKIAGVRTV